MSDPPHDGLRNPIQSTLGATCAMTPRLPQRAYPVLGAATLLALQVQYALLWRSYYSRVAFRGYGLATADGDMPPFLTTTPRASTVGHVVLILLPP
jgi:hypothetical protein